MNAEKITDLLLRAYQGDTDAQARVSRNYVEMCSFHETMNNDMKQVGNAISHGRLETRADPSQYYGEYRKIIESMNTMLDAVTGPLLMSIEYTGQLGRGVLPKKITGMRYGDFNQVKNNLNTCIDAFTSLGNATGSSVQETIRHEKTPGMLNGTSNFSKRIDDTAHVQGDRISAGNQVTNTSAVLPGVLSTISLQVSEIADQNQRTTISAKKLASDTARVARNAIVVHFHAERGDEKVRKISLGMKELSAGIQEFSSGTDTVYRLAKKTTRLAGAATEQAARIKDGLTGISLTASEADARLSDIVALADRIGDTTGHLVKIADRAKTLATTALKEKGGPGNYAGNVPVTAREMTFLAESSRESAEKITGFARDLSKKSLQAKGALETLNHGLTVENAAFSGTAGIFSQVAGSVEQISRDMDDLSIASGVQGRSIMKLAAEMQNVNYIVQGTAEKASDVASASRNASSSLFQVAQDMAEINRFARNVTAGTTKYQE